MCQEVQDALFCPLQEKFRTALKGVRNIPGAVTIPLSNFPCKAPFCCPFRTSRAPSEILAMQSAEGEVVPLYKTLKARGN